MTDELDIEALLEAPFRKPGTPALKKTTSSGVKERRENRSRSRSRSRGHSRSRSRRYRHSRSRSRSPHSRRHGRHQETQQHRYHHRNRSGSRERNRDRSTSTTATLKAHPALTQGAEEAATPATSVLTEAQRDRRTVFCRQLAQRLEGKELKEFCEQAGRVRDVRIVYDKISRRSKGVAYVEFYEEESVPKAVALTGQKLLSIPIIVEITETEKNRIAEEAAEAARRAKQQQGPAPSKIHLTGLHPSLREADLKRIFDPFGDILSITMGRELLANGTAAASIHYRFPNDAAQAMERMNGFELAGHPICITFAKAVPPIATAGTTTLEEPDSLDPVLAATSRSELMLKLARESSLLKSTSISNGAPLPSTTGSASIPAPTSIISSPPNNALSLATATVDVHHTCAHLRDMYDLSAETAPRWDLEIAEEVREECAKFGRVLDVRVPRTDSGDVYVRFALADAARSAVAGLNGRWFAGRQIGASTLSLDQYYML